MFHNAQNQRIRQEVQKLKTMYSGQQRHQLEANDPQLATALENAVASGNDIELEKIVGERLKAMMEKNRKE